VTRPKTQITPEPVSPRLVRSLVHPDRKATVSTVRFSADGRRLFTAGYPSGMLQFWDVAAGKELRRIDTPRGYRGSSEYAELPADWSAVYVPWEKRKVVRFERNGESDTRIELDGSVLAFDATTGQPRPSLQPAAGHSVVVAYLSPDGARLVALERPSYLRNEHKSDVVVLWDVPAGARRVIGEGYPMVAYTPDSKRFALTRNDYDPQSGVLKLFDADGTELAEVARVKGGVFTWPKVSPDGRLLAVEQSKQRINLPATIRVWDLESRKELASFRSGGDFPFMEFAFSPDGKQLAAIDYNGRLRLWKIATGRPVREQDFAATMLRHVAFSPDGKRLAVQAQPEWERFKARDVPEPQGVPQPRVFLFDLTATGAGPEVVICPHGFCGGLAFSPDGKTLAVGGTGAAHLFDLTAQR
jgi:WD40 repeat protein